MIVAKWKDGVGFFRQADAQKVASEIMEICEDIGSAPKSEILNKARDEDTELHKCFEWDDGIAAEQYRLFQAGHIVRTLVIKQERDPEDEAERKPEIRFFYKAESSEGYKPTTKIVRDKDSYDATLARAFSELQAFKAKYYMITELESVIAAIDSL